MSVVYAIALHLFRKYTWQTTSCQADLLGKWETHAQVMVSNYYTAPSCGRDQGK